MVKSVLISLSAVLLFTGCWGTTYVYPRLALPEASYGYSSDETSYHTTGKQDIDAILRTHGPRVAIRDVDEDQKIETGYMKCRKNEIYLFDMIRKHNKHADSKMK